MNNFPVEVCPKCCIVPCYLKLDLTRCPVILSGNPRVTAEAQEALAPRTAPRRSPLGLKPSSGDVHGHPFKTQVLVHPGPQPRASTEPTPWHPGRLPLSIHRHLTRMCLVTCPPPSLRRLGSPRGQGCFCSRSPRSAQGLAQRTSRHAALSARRSAAHGGLL